jgi:DNA-binding transcriptional ArsR family regulator
MTKPRKSRRKAGELARHVARLNGLGLNDTDIAKRLGVPQPNVWFARTRQGLPVRPRNRDSVLAGHARRHANYGSSWTPKLLRMVGEGWPAGVTPRQADVLLLLERGPMTTRRIAEALGMKYFAVSKLLAKLRRVEAVERRAGGLYALTAAVVASRARACGPRGGPGDFTPRTVRDMQPRRVHCG